MCWQSTSAFLLVTLRRRPYERLSVLVYKSRVLEGTWGKNICLNSRDPQSIPVLEAFLKNEEAYVFMLLPLFLFFKERDVSVEAA